MSLRFVLSVQLQLQIISTNEYYDTLLIIYFRDGSYIYDYVASVENPNGYGRC